MITRELLFYAIAGGLVPAFIWLWFWLREDKRNPEPKKALAWAFLGGILSIAPTLVLQFLVESWSPYIGVITLGAAAIIPIILNSAIEETMKLTFCWITALRTKENNEPIDAVIYLITTALGFAATENTLFIISSYLSTTGWDGILTSLVVGNVRFIGASLLHVAASATIGLFLAFAYYKPFKKKVFAVINGLVIAIALHTYFNFLIMRSETGFLLSFPLVWIAVILLIIFFERIKRLRK